MQTHILNNKKNTRSHISHRNHIRSTPWHRQASSQSGNKQHTWSHTYTVKQNEMLQGFPGVSDNKNLAAKQETQIWSLGRGDPLEKKTATHSSILAYRFPWSEEPGVLQLMGSQRVRHNWAIFTFSLHWSTPNQVKALNEWGTQAPFTKKNYPIDTVLCCA